MEEMSVEEIQQLDELYKKRNEFRDKLIELINKYNLENDSNTPDYMIADCMIRAYLSMNELIFDRDEWYGVHLEPGNKYFEKEGMKDDSKSNL